MKIILIFMNCPFMIHTSEPSREPLPTKDASTSHLVSRHRYLLVAAIMIFTAVATATYLSALLRIDGINSFEFLSVPLFVVLFGWIAFSFLVATIGFVQETRDRSATEDHQDQLCNSDQLSSRTAVLVPVYNEDPHRVCADIAAMIDTLQLVGAAHAFDFFILSDSEKPQVWIEEEITWSKLRDQYADTCGVYYRHRARNVARKSGNVADFCERWGDRYPFMIILDADSLLDGQTMITLAHRMEMDSCLGILQVPSLPIGRSSVFARMQQFSAQAYGPVFTRGLAAWSGDEGNYWGHNAIIRVRPFMDHCDLPVLDGKPPFGGEILSHDFVEAAFMIRAGWKVRLATDLSGSYEECPTTIADFAIRDQRWCQGNLQHTRMLLSQGFAPTSRFHFATGIMSYVASPVWGMFMLIGLLGMVVDHDTNHAVSSPVPFVVRGELILFLATLLMLLLPKVWGILRLVGRPSERRKFGGTTRVFTSAFIETLASVLLSPIMAVYQSRFVWSTLRGKQVKWKAQQRTEKYVSWSDAVVQNWSMTALGMISVVVLAFAAPSLLAWFAPLALGLLLSIPLEVLMGSARVGKWLGKWGLLRIPEEVEPPYLVRQHQLHLDNPLVDHQVLRSQNLLNAVIENPARFIMHMQIQKASEQNRPMPVEMRDALLTASRDGTFDAQSRDLERHILLDSELLEELHVEAQLRIAGTMTSNSR